MLILFYLSVFLVIDNYLFLTIYTRDKCVGKMWITCGKTEDKRAFLTWIQLKCSDSCIKITGWMTLINMMYIQVIYMNNKDLCNPKNKED